MKTLAERLKEAREWKGWKQAQLAIAADVSTGTIGNIEAGIRKSKGSIPQIADALGVSYQWLANGTGDMLDSKNTSNILTVHVQQGLTAINNISNISAARAYSGEVPVINWVQAGAWQEVADMVNPERYLPIFRGHSSNSFALRVRGDSMTAAHGKSYPDGCFIIVDPAKLSPVNGDRVIARLRGVSEATFKVFKNEDGRQWLAPLNPMHQPIYDGFTVVGTVIGKWEDD